MIPGPQASGDRDLLAPGWRELWQAGNGVTLHAVEAGRPGDPLLILLHGFPDFWWTWRKQIGPLAAAGYHVVAPDLRGYNLSSAPRARSAYRLDRLVGDVLALADAQGAARFRLVGHDWGAAIGWELAADHGERIEGMVVLDGPQLDAWAIEARRHPAQALRSAYIAGFQLPWLPEAALGAFDFAMLKALIRGSARRDAFAPGDLERQARAWSRGSLRAMIDYYRALRLRPRRPPPRIAPPTLVLGGSDDRFLSRSVMAASAALCRNGRLIEIGGASHWLHLEVPERINAEIGCFFGRPGRRYRGS